MKMAELFLVCGLGAVALGAGLLPFPMNGLIGAGLLPIALVLLVAAFAMLPTPTGISRGRRRLIFLLFLVASMLLVFIAGEATLMAFDSITDAGQSGLAKVTTLEWILLALSSLLPASLMFLALHFRSTWTQRRCALWALAVLLVAPIGVTIFKLLAPFLPLNV